MPGMPGGMPSGMPGTVAIVDLPASAVVFASANANSDAAINTVTGGNWNSGGYGPGWIEFTFAQQFYFTSLTAVADILPDCLVTYQISCDANNILTETVYTASQ